MTPPTAEEDLNRNSPGAAFEPRQESFQARKASVRLAVDHDLDLLGCELTERHVHGDAQTGGEAQQVLEQAPVGRSGPGRDRPVADRPGRVRDDALEIQLDAPPGSLAAGTGTQRTVESEQVDLGLEMIGPALAAPPASHECALARRDQQPASAQAASEGRF